MQVISENVANQGKNTINLDLQVTNFGPIADGRVKLCPLTVFVGPNGSGKSYMAKLIHSMTKAHRDSVDVLLKSYFESMNEPMTSLSENKSTWPFTSVDPGALDETIKNRLEDEFGGNLEDLIRFGTDACVIRLLTDTNETRVDLSTPGCAFTRKHNPKTRIELNEHTGSMEFKAYHTGLLSAENNVIIRTPALYPLYENDLKFSKQLASDIDNYAPNSFYLPAVRSLILQKYKTLAGGIIGSFNDLRINGLNLAGEAVNFMANLIKFPDSGGDYARLASDLEQEILDGRVEVESGGDITQIAFWQNDKKIPWQNTSSLASALAPLVLYLRHAARRGGLLVIEEPEMNMHPGNQAILAKYLVRLANAGLNIVITTHSIYIIEKLSNLVQAHGLTPKERKVVLSEGQDSMEPDRIGVHVFNHGRITRIKVSVNDGISGDEFTNISQILYNEYASIQNSIDDDHKLSQ